MKEDIKIRLRLLRPDLDQWITTYIITIMILYYINFNNIGDLITLSVASIVGVVMYTSRSAYGKLIYEKSNHNIRVVSETLMSSWLMVSVPLALLILGSLSPSLNMASVVLATVFMTTLSAFGVNIAKARLRSTICRNKSGADYNKALIFRRGNLFKMLYGRVAVYVYVDAQCDKDIFKAIDEDKGDMPKATHISKEIITAMSKEIILSDDKDAEKKLRDTLANTHEIGFVL